jgi:hypothetical protein
MRRDGRAFITIHDERRAQWRGACRGRRATAPPSRTATMSRATYLILAVIVVVFVGAMVFLFLPHGGRPTPQAGQPGANLPGAGARATPVEETFRGCPPEGRGGDSQLNLLKNRIDEAAWQPTTIDTMLALRWPKGTENRRMSGWSEADRTEVARNNGLPMQVEGYLLLVRQQGAESTNCGSTAATEVDWHMWLASRPNDDRGTKSVVIEATPRVRAKHPSWALDAVQTLAREDTRVRISGWAMLDPEHPEEVGKSRGTIWEIHPIMKIEAQQAGGGWREL